MYNTNETHYMRFKSELDRQRTVNTWTESPYYIGHFQYERENNDTLAGNDFMLGLTIGNFAGQGLPPTGLHVAIPLYGDAPKDGEAGND